MKKSLAILLFFAAPVAAETMDFSKFGGLDTESSPATLTNMTPDSENVVTDLSGGLVPRDGFTLCHASSATAQWVFRHSNGTVYQIIRVGGALKADSGGCNFSTTISTVPATGTVAAAALGDKFFFMDTTNGLKYWDATSVTVASATLKGTQLAAHKNRLWAAALASDPRAVRASEFDDGTSWDIVTDPIVTDPAIFVIGGAVGDTLTALYSSHLGALVWMGSRSFGVISGDSRANFDVRVYSDNVGTAYPDSIRDCDGLLRWLGPARTIYEWNGSELKNIGISIQTYLGTIGQGDANSRSYTITTEADYNTGTLYQKSSSISSGDIILSTWTDTDNTTAEFALGATFTNVTTTTVSNAIALSTNIINGGVENGAVGCASSGEIATGWTADGPALCADGFQPHSGSKVMYPVTSTAFTEFKVIILSSSDVVLETLSDDLASLGSSYTLITKDISSHASVSIKVRFQAVSPDGTYKITTTNAFVSDGGSLSYWAKLTSGVIIQIDDVVDIHSGTFLSRTFDTALSSSAWTATTPTYTNNDYTTTFQTQTSSDGVTFNSLATWTPGSAPTSDFSRHIRYKISFATSTNGITPPYVSAVPIASRANYGAFISSAIATGSPTSWNPFGASTDDNGGTVTYAVYTDSDTSMSITNGVPTTGFVSSQTITSGAYVTLSTAAYIRIGETETITVSTHTPTNHSLTASWVEGVTTPSPSAWFRQRYWLGVSRNSSTNNKVLVFDRNRQWQRYSGINASSLGIFNGNLFFGNSVGLYQYELGDDDAGAAIASYYRTPTFSPSGPSLGNVFEDVRVTTEESASTLTTSYQINGSDNADYDLGDYDLDTDAGIQNFSLPFPIDQLHIGRNISFLFSVTSSTPWRILGFTLTHTPDVVPSP